MVNCKSIYIGFWKEDDHECWIFSIEATCKAVSNDTRWLTYMLKISVCPRDLALDISLIEQLSLFVYACVCFWYTHSALIYYFFPSTYCICVGYPSKYLSFLQMLSSAHPHITTLWQKLCPCLTMVDWIDIKCLEMLRYGEYISRECALVGIVNLQSLRLLNYGHHITMHIDGENRWSVCILT